MVQHAPSKEDNWSHSFSATECERLEDGCDEELDIIGG